MTDRFVRRLGACALGLAILLFFGLPFARAETCRASWYGTESGTRTANGERFNPGGMTAASLRYPFGAHLAVTFRGRTVVVRINDRGPARWTGRCLDLARSAAARIGLTRAGVGTVTIRRVR